MESIIAFLSTLLLVLLGYFLKRRRIITETDGKVISRFLMHTTFPALLFISAYNAKITPSLFLIPATHLLVSSLMLAVGWFVLRNYPKQLKGLLLLTFGATNVGMLGYPIVEQLLGEEGIKYAIMYDLGNTIFGFVIVYPLSKSLSAQGDGKLSIEFILKKVLSLPPFVGLLLGLFCNVLKLSLPDFLLNIITILAQGNKPIGLLMLGIFMSFALSKEAVSGITKSLITKYFFNVLTIVLIYIFVKDEMAKYSLILCVALPLGLTLLPFAVELDYDTKTGGALVNISLLISVILILFLILFLNIG
jgi:malate permease and related proteins